MKKIIKNLMIIIAICMTNTSFAAQNLPPVKLEVYYGGTLCPENKIVYINAAPQLLDLKTKLMWEKDSQATKNASVSWKAEIVFNRSPRNDKKSFSAQKKGNEEWNVWNTKTSDLFGGKVTITAIIEEKSLKRILHIRGKNPGDETIKNLIGASPWYAIPIAKHESRLMQFNKGSASANNLTNECPNRSSDTIGWGIFQITNPAPTIDELWNWRANITAGLRVLATKRQDAMRWMMAPVGSSDYPNGGQRIQCFIRTGINHKIPNYNTNGVKKITLSDENNARYSFEDALTIKLFNGASPQFVSWNNANGTWKINGGIYVDKVCDEL